MLISDPYFIAECRLAPIILGFSDIGVPDFVIKSSYNPKDRHEVYKNSSNNVTINIQFRKGSFRRKKKYDA